VGAVDDRGGARRGGEPLHEPRQIAGAPLLSQSQSEQQLVLIATDVLIANATHVERARCPIGKRPHEAVELSGGRGGADLGAGLFDRLIDRNMAVEADDPGADRPLGEVIQGRLRGFERALLVCDRRRLRNDRAILLERGARGGVRQKRLDDGARLYHHGVEAREQGLRGGVGMGAAQSA
jgi:hypothetical protein